jgi:hypothetical protein
MAAPKKLKVTITFDNRTTRTLTLSHHDYVIVLTAIREARLGNALQVVDLDGGLETSYPELHSGTHQHIGEMNGPLRLWTAKRDPFDGYRVLNSEREFVRKLGASRG